MSTGLLFVTADNADYKVVNRLLLHLYDWEFNSGDSFHVVLSESDVERSRFKDSERNQLSETKAGALTAEKFENEWVGVSVQDVEKYLLDQDKTGDDGDGISLFVVLDEQGVQDKTCIIAERHVEWDDDADPPRRLSKEEMEATYEYNKYRAPWDETHVVYANLSIGNMDFEDYADEDEEPDADGWWRFRGHGSLMEEEDVERRERAMRELEGEGRI